MSKKLIMQEKINILNELNEAGASALMQTDNKNYFFLPENYFAEFSENVMAHIFLRSIPVKNIFSVPENYFEAFHESLLKKIKLQTDIKQAAKKNVYFVPDGYFDNLAENILAKIKHSSADSVQQELEEIAPLLSKLPKSNVYSIPENYFSNFAGSISTVSTKPAAKIISLNAHRDKWFRYAAAACVAAVLFLGGYFYNADKNNSKSSFAKMDVQKEISNLSDDEIADYLKNSTNTSISVNVNNEDSQFPNMDIQNLLQNMSDEELQQYLDQHPEPVQQPEGS